MDNETIQKQALEFAKKNRTRIAREFADVAKYKPDDVPISVFMAGSPGAGKTEFSKNLIEIIEKTVPSVIRIDGDEFRGLIPGYNGGNSEFFQGAVSLIVERVHDHALKYKQSFILDGTFSKYKKAVDNIKRSLEKNRLVFIFYVYQQPEVAWRLTQAREVKEGRNIPKEAFIEQFFGAREVVDIILEEYPKVKIFLVRKNYEKKMEDLFFIEARKNKIDDYIKDEYTKEELQKLL